MTGMNGSAPKRGGRRGGFTLIETMTVLLIAGALTRIAIPNLQVMLQRARATEILADVRVVEVAAAEYNAGTMDWPASSDPGEVPPGLVPYLPEGFSFDRDDYTLSWHRWELPDALPENTGTSLLLGIQVGSVDEGVGSALLELAGGDEAFFVLQDDYIFVVNGS